MSLEPPTLADLLARRHLVSDATLLDWAEVTSLASRSGRVCSDQLQAFWQLSQPAVSRRLRRLAAAGLLQYRAGGGYYRLQPGPSTLAI